MWRAMSVAEQDAHWMRLALAEAQAAADAGEVPVGAVLVQGEQLIATGRNAPIASHDPCAHAEILALRAAAQHLGNYRLDGCTLYVTLEPCAMCSGAMLHARLSRVVFGATEPKTGAAGSVLNLFELAQLNHQTHVEGGVLAADCARLLRDFFKPRRINQHPLRDDALRTPEARFADVSASPAPSCYVSDLPSLAGLRLHYLDTGAPSANSAPEAHAPWTWLCLHTIPGWSHELHPWVAALAAAGQRVIAPDLIGFGRSDKPKKERYHCFTTHRQVLLELIDRLDLRNLVLLLPESHTLGLSLPLVAPQRYRGLVLRAAARVPELVQQAPFPDAGHTAGPRSAARWQQPEDADLAVAIHQFWQGAEQAHGLLGYACASLDDDTHALHVQAALAALHNTQPFLKELEA